MTTERADAARNRAVLIETAREMLTDVGIERLTMDALAERSGLGKGTVFRRFGTRSGIFMALLGDGERAFQKRVLSGPPPLGPGAEPLDRLVAFGPARLGFLMENREIARAALGVQDEAEIVRGGSTARVTLGQLLGQCQRCPEVALRGGEVAGVGAGDPLLADALPLGGDVLAERRACEQGQRQQDDVSQWLRRGLPYCSTILRCSTAGSRQAPVESWPTMLR